MRNKIEKTKAFSSLSKIQKSIYGKRAIMLEIENQFIIAKNKGVEQWQTDCQPIPIYKSIINELLEYENNASN